jgi:hypothetical protein
MMRNMIVVGRSMIGRSMSMTRSIKVVQEVQEAIKKMRISRSRSSKAG